MYQNGLLAVTTKNFKNLFEDPQAWVRL